MKLSAEKVALLSIPYLLVLSIFYNNGYWSFFSLSVFNYYEAQDIVKDIAGPLFKFGGLLIAPLFLAATSIASMFSDSKQISQELVKKAELEAKLDWRSLPLAKKTLEIIRFILIVLLVVGASLLFVFIVTMVFYPIEDDGDFVLKYLSSLDDYSPMRLIYIILLTIIGTSIITKRAQGVSDIDSIKIAITVASLSLTTVIAYHYGRIEAYKIISGTNFRYWISKDGVGHKYMAHINKNYIFLNDVKYINPYGKEYRLDTLVFDSRIVIISEDSLKSVELDYFGLNTKYTSSAFKKAFISRNGGKKY
jgi:hypothetical protein